MTPEEQIERELSYSFTVLVPFEHYDTFREHLPPSPGEPWADMIDSVLYPPNVKRKVDHGYFGPIFAWAQQLNARVDRIDLSSAFIRLVRAE